MKPIDVDTARSPETLVSWLNDLWKLVELCKCKIETGTYDGDGATSLDVTLEFDPKYVKIWPDLGEAEGDIEIFEATDEITSGYCSAHSVTATHEHYQLDNRLITLGTKKFTVDDDGGDNHPNKDGQTYYYLALG